MTTTLPTTLAIDPGNRKSAIIALADDGTPVDWLYAENKEVIRWALTHLAEYNCPHLVIEMIASFGMPVGAEVFETAFWIGRFYQAIPAEHKSRIGRKQVKIHLCNSVKAKDGNIRQALIDRFGGDSVAIGGKKCSRCKGKGWFGAGRPVCDRCNGSKWDDPPGPLKGISGDVWSALAVGVFYVDCVKPDRREQTELGQHLREAQKRLAL